MEDHLREPEYKEPKEIDCSECDGDGCEHCDFTGTVDQSHDEYERDALDHKADNERD